MPPSYERKFTRFGRKVQRFWRHNFGSCRSICCCCSYWQMFLLQLRKLFNTESKCVWVCETGRGREQSRCALCKERENTVQGERSTHTHTVGRGREYAAFWFIEWPINLLLGGGCDCDGDRDSKGVRDGCSCRLGGTASATTAVVGALNLAFLKNLCWVRSLWRWHFLL